MDGERTARILEKVLDLDKNTITVHQAIEIEYILFNKLQKSLNDLRKLQALEETYCSDKSKPFTACALVQKKNTNKHKKLLSPFLRFFYGSKKQG